MPVTVDCDLDLSLYREAEVITRSNGIQSFATEVTAKSILPVCKGL